MVKPLDHYYSVTLTKEGMRQVVEAYATCLEHLASFPCKCDIVERARDGMFLLSMTIPFPPRKRSVQKSR